MGHTKGSGPWYRDRIIKELSRVEGVGRRPSRIFEDWVALVHANLTELPHHMQAAAEGRQHEDSPETAAVFERMRSIYKPWCWQHFTRAQGLLFLAAENTYEDVIGLTYMEWGWPSKGNGQYFTAFNVARMMAQVTAAPWEGTKPGVDERIQEAISKSPAATAALLAGLTVPQDLAESWFVARVIPPALEHYEPVKVNDAACGSGVMFLAYASAVPWWHTKLGLVQFYGQDIDQLCVSMCQINSMAHGLNGRYAPYFIAYHDYLLRTQAPNSDTPSEHDHADEEGAADEPPPPALEEAEGWDPNDYVQQSLFDDGEQVREIRPAYEVMEVS